MLKVDLLFAEQTGFDFAVGCDAEAVAGPAEVRAHRRDETDATLPLGTSAEPLGGVVGRTLLGVEVDLGVERCV